VQHYPDYLFTSTSSLPKSAPDQQLLPRLNGDNMPLPLAGSMAAAVGPLFSRGAWDGDEVDGTSSDDGEYPNGAGVASGSGLAHAGSEGFSLGTIDNR
jgi:hypothetical protein